MRGLTPKQQARLEKKKKRMAALVEIIKLNNKDGRKKSPANDRGSEKSSSSSIDNTPSTSPEPKRKKLKQNQPNNEPEGSTTQSNENSKEIVLSDQMYTELKKSVNERTRNSRYKPEIRLNLFGDSASLSINAKERTPIFLTDIQHLVMAALLGTESPCTPSRWCVLEKRNQITHTIVLVVEGISLFHYSTYESVFKETSQLFEHKLEVVMPPHQDGQIVDELARVPLTDSNRKDLIDKYGSLEVAIESTQDPLLLMKSMFPVDEQMDLKIESNDNQGEVIPRTQLLLSALQMVEEGYPLPLRGELANRYKNFVLTKDCYEKVTATSPMFGLDCEMCRTSAGINELTRISIVDENYKSVYETLVRPQNKIVDYLTQYSGITGEMMLKVTKTLTEVQSDVRELLPADAILVGQSLQSDLMAMRMMHPYVIDTSVIFNLSGQRKVKSKLQTLSYEFLGEKIQDNPLGHDSIEDSVAGLKLTKLKMSKGLYFGDEVLSGRKRANENSKTNNKPDKEKDTSTAFIISSETDMDCSKFKTQDLVSSSPTITIHSAESNKVAIRKTRDLCISSALTISYLKVRPERLELTKIEKTLSKTDRWIASVWDSVAPKGLFVVLMGGVPGASSGVALLKIKKSNSSSQVE